MKKTVAEGDMAIISAMFILHPSAFILKVV
jgi:hypothetical protein